MGWRKWLYGLAASLLLSQYWKSICPSAGGLDEMMALLSSTWVGDDQSDNPKVQPAVSLSSCVKATKYHFILWWHGGERPVLKVSWCEGSFSPGGSIHSCKGIQNLPKTLEIPGATETVVMEGASDGLGPVKVKNLFCKNLLCRKCVVWRKIQTFTKSCIFQTENLASFACFVWAT